MKLNFKHIKIENFLSIGNAEIDLVDSGYTFVTGINENPSDNALSNGSGKSSLWEAISWCLCGETIRGNCKDIVNINTDGGAFVELLFDVDTKKYRIIRTKNHKDLKTTLKIYIDDVDVSGKGIRDTEKLLAEYLPDLTSSLIGSVVILGQGMPQRFSNNTPSGRKEVLEKLSKSDFMIQDLKERLNQRKSTLSALLRDSEDNVLKLTTKLDISRTTMQKDTDTLKSLQTTTNYDLLISNISDTLNKVEESKRAEEVVLAQYTRNLEAAYDKSRNLYTEREEALNEIDTKYRSTLETLAISVQEFSTAYQLARNKLEELRNIKDVCPTCNQKLPDVHKPDTTELEAQVEGKYTQLQEVTTERDRIQSEYHSEHGAVSQTYMNRDNEVAQEISFHKQQKVEIERKISTLTRETELHKVELASVVNKRDNLQKDIQECETRIKVTQEEIVALEADILYNNNIKSDLQKRLDIITKFNSIVTRDFRGHLLLNVISFIDEKAKEYSQDIFGTNLIEFKLDGNQLSIAYDGKQYESLSGGEKQKVDVIVQFAIRDMMCKFLGFSSNILVVDEIFDNLDRVGCEKVINLISTKLSDISSVFIVSHHSDIDIPYDRELVVIKDMNGVSRVCQ